MGKIEHTQGIWEEHKDGTSSLSMAIRQDGDDWQVAGVGEFCGGDIKKFIPMGFNRGEIVIATGRSPFVAVNDPIYAFDLVPLDDGRVMVGLLEDWVRARPPHQVRDWIAENLVVGRNYRIGFQATPAKAKAEVKDHSQESRVAFNLKLIADESDKHRSFNMRLRIAEAVEELAHSPRLRREHSNVSGWSPREIIISHIRVNDRKD